MKCAKCRTENKENVKTCRKCGMELTPAAVWHPAWKWHVRTLAIIYATLIAAFFILNFLLKPYLRQIPKDITPWLKDVPAKSQVG